MHESYAEALIPLGDMPELRNRYANFQKTVRFGRLLEDLDTMAGLLFYIYFALENILSIIFNSFFQVHISYLHNRSQNVIIKNQEISPIVIVTALVDRIEVRDMKIDMNKNIKLSGFTSWVGKSSSEITMKLEQELAPNVWNQVLEAKFLVCARDTNNIGSALMNPIEIVTDEEKAIFELGESWS